MKVAVYSRVSSDKQDVDLSISAQLRALRDYRRETSNGRLSLFGERAVSPAPVFHGRIKPSRKSSITGAAVIYPSRK